MSIYVDKPRSPEPRTKQPSESLFEFIDRLEHPWLTDARAFVNDSVGLAPLAIRSEFERRLRSRTDSDHLSACFELFTVRRMRDAGLDVRFRETAGDGSQPDLEWTTRGGQCVSIEATLVNEPSDDVLFKLIQAASPYIHDRRLRIWVYDSHKGRSAASPRTLAKYLNRWRTELSPSSGNSNPTGLVRLSQRRRIRDRRGTRLTLSLWLSPEHADQHAVLQLASPTRVFFDQSADILLRKIKQKRRQHRRLAQPVILVVGWNGFTNPLTIAGADSSVRRYSAMRANSRPLCIDMLVADHFYPWSIQRCAFALWRLGGDLPEWPLDEWPTPPLLPQTEQ